MSKLSKILFLLSGISLVSFLIVRFLLGVWIPFLWIMLGTFIGLFVAAIWLDRAFYKDFFGMKTTRQGMSMGGMIAMVLIVLIAVNFVGVRKYKTFDFSMAQVNTLSEQSVKLVKGLTEDLGVLYFYKDGTEGVENNRRAFIDLMKKYQDQSDRVKLQFVEVNEHPDLAEKYGIHQATQEVVMDYQGRQTRIEKIDEQEITSGIVKVTRTSSKKIYILSGHGEFPMVPAKDGSSISLLKELLAGSRYTVEDYSFNKATEVPKDADVLMILGPQTGFLDIETKAVEDYLNRGGSVILALNSASKSGLESLAKKTGVLYQPRFVASIVQTPFGVGVDPRFAKASVFSADHQITKPFTGNQFTVFHLPSYMTHAESIPEDIVVDDIVKTADNVLVFKDMDFKKGGEKLAVTLGVAVHGKLNKKAPKEFNLLAFSDAHFLDDQFLYQNLNRDLLLNSVAFLAKEENLISISPKEVDASQLTMTETGFGLFVFGFIIPLPLLLFGGSGWLWYRRRYA